MKNFNWPLLEQNDRKKINKLLNGLNISFGYNKSNYKQYSKEWFIDECRFYLTFHPVIEDLNTLYLKVFKSMM